MTHTDTVDTKQKIVEDLLKVDDDFEITMTGKQFRELYRSSLTQLEREGGDKRKSFRSITRYAVRNERL